MVSTILEVEPKNKKVRTRRASYRMIDFLQYIENTNAAKSSEEIFLYFERALGKLGFDLVLYSLMTDHATIDKKAGHGIMRNYSEDWMKYYTEKGYADVDPVRKQVMLTTHPFLWDKLNTNTSYSDDQRLMMYEAEDAGLRCGIGLGIHCSGREIAGFGFASSDGSAEINKNVVSMVKALASQFHAAYTDHERRFGLWQPPKLVNITDDEKQILYFMMMGKSNSVIGDILNQNVHTIDYHVRNIFMKLEANTRTYAVVKAIRYGLINP